MPEQMLEPGAAHALMLCVVAVMGGAILGLPRVTGPRGVTVVAWATAVFMLAQETLDRVLHHTMNGEPWTEVLPRAIALKLTSGAGFL